MSALLRIRNLSRWRHRARLELPAAQLGPGSGPFVSVSECAPQTAYFHSTEEAAQRAVRRLDETGCGGKGCQGRHSTGLVAMHWTMPLG